MSKIVHCWTSEREWIEETYGDKSDEYFDFMVSDKPNRSCVLLHGHDGPHEWTDDENIVVRFKGTQTPETAERKESR